MTRALLPCARVVVAATALLLTACAHQFAGPAVHASATPTPNQTGGLRAGFGRADITPPPGPGLMGYGPEGKAARGWRQRLHARVLILEDVKGERLGLVTLDLGQLSVLLHHEVAARVRDATGLGPDRLILTATHTHAGPGHHFGTPAYDLLGSSVSGYDPALVQFLADRIARAVMDAHANMANAQAAWGTRAIWDLTKNRSEDAFDRNPAAWKNRFRRPLGNRDVSGKVDSTLAILRVDLWDATSSTYRPAGAFTVFAIHGTGNPSANELFDSDIQGLAARVLEAHIDAANRAAGTNTRPAVHLVANGAEGDVAPAMRADTRCWVPALVRVRRPTGPHAPPGPELWIPQRADSQAACILRARAWTDTLGTRLGAAAAAIFDSLGTHLTRNIEIGRVFRIARLTDAAEFVDLCKPQSGVATLGGAEDGYTRYRNWELFGVHNVGFAEDSAVSAHSERRGCHGVKKRFLGRLQRRVAAKLLPEHAQITVARIGETVLATVPFEATTIVGGKIREAALLAATRQRSAPKRALLIGLANGYNQYVATEEEYRLQHYEGASTLFGPSTADYLVSIIRKLAEQLPSSGQPSPPADVQSIEFAHYGESAVLPAPTTGPNAASIEPRKLSGNWRGDTLFVRWTDLHPGRLIPADGLLLEIRQAHAAGDTSVIQDGHESLEIWSLGRARGKAWQWEARWRPSHRPDGSTDVLLLRRPGLSEVRITVPAATTSTSL